MPTAAKRRLVIVISLIAVRSTRAWWRDALIDAGLNQTQSVSQIIQPSQVSGFAVQGTIHKWVFAPTYNVVVPRLTRTGGDLVVRGVNSKETIYGGAIAPRK